MSEYFAKVKIIDKDGGVTKIKGEVTSLLLENDTVEKNDGVVAWREFTGHQRVTIVIEREVEVVK